jgi:hypothetical protein
MNIKYLTFFSIAAIVISSCKKFLQIDPPKNQVVSSVVYDNDATATSVISGIYSTMFSSNGIASGGSGSFTVYGGYSSDELINYQADQDILQMYENALLPTNGYVFNLWQQAYQYISNANALIEGLATSNGVDDATKAELIGQAKFVRAFCYFYLVNLYGAVPIITSANYQINEVAARSTAEEVYALIISDLSDAQASLSADYSFSNGEKDEPNQGAATALLARIYLWTNNWTGADSAATAVVNNKASYSLCADLDSVFLANSSEAIWQLKPIEGSNYNTNEGSFFILTEAPSNASLSTYVINAFELMDNRRVQWVDSIITNGTTYYFPYKYKILTSSTLSEYSMILRLAEQYLIRAEAEAQMNHLSLAAADLNMIRNRAGLPNISNSIASSQSSLLTAILHERQVELFTEWGHRWLDLKRTGSVDSVMSIVTPGKGGGTWVTTQQLYPVPQSEIINDNKLTQNAGYPE